MFWNLNNLSEVQVRHVFDMPAPDQLHDVPGGIVVVKDAIAIQTLNSQAVLLGGTATQRLLWSSSIDPVNNDLCNGSTCVFCLFEETSMEFEVKEILNRFAWCGKW